MFLILNFAENVSSVYFLMTRFFLNHRRVVTTEGHSGVTLCPIVHVFKRDEEKTESLKMT